MKSTIPAWVKSIPQGSHGSGHLQKRLWTLVSSYVRIRDFYKYGGQCVAGKGIRITNWRNGDAGHYKSYSVCNGLFKFDPMNIHLQNKSSNGWGGQDIGHAFGEELKRRYGPDILEDIERKNRATSLKFTQGQILALMINLIGNMRALPEQPDYFAKLPDPL